MFSFTSVVTEPLFKKNTDCEHPFYSLDKALGTLMFCILIVTN